MGVLFPSLAIPPLHQLQERKLTRSATVTFKWVVLATSRFPEKHTWGTIHQINWTIPTLRFCYCKTKAGPSASFW